MEKGSKQDRTKEMFSLVQSCMDSGISRKAFCEQQGLNASIYYYWQKKYKETMTSVSSGFIPVKCQATGPKLATGIEICYPNGVRIQIADHTDLAMIRLLVGLF